MKLKGLVAVLALTVLTTGCYRMTPLGNGQSSQGSLGLDLPAKFATLDVGTLKSVMATQLRIPAGNPDLCADDTCAQKTKYFPKYESTLGQGDASKGIAPNFSASPLKSKIMFQLSIDGCAQGLQDAQVKARLFPNGVNDFKSVYLTFLGREPDAQETQILTDLVRSVSAATAPAAVCSAVLSSIEFQNRS